MLAKILIFAGLASAGLLLIILTTTTPSSSGAFGILSVFLLGYVVCLSVLTFIIWFSAILTGQALTKTKLSRKDYSMPLKRAYYFSTIVSLAPIIMVSLQSVGGVGPYEAGLIALFIALGCIYIARRIP
jgi:hypothetical protein